MVECWQCSASLDRGELMRIYLATATKHGYTFKVLVGSALAPGQRQRQWQDLSVFQCCLNMLVSLLARLA